jgi:hypothetical protein
MPDLRRPGTMTEALSLPYRERERSVTMAPMGEEHDELLTINIGPHHPATHGVLRLLTTLEGEIVRDVKPIIGYVHTGIEKSCEDQQYWKVIPFVERMDYLSYYFNAMAFCMAVERLLDEEVPTRAQWLRVIHLELNRIMSHLVWLGTSALDLGAISMFWYGFREREQVRRDPVQLHVSHAQVLRPRRHLLLEQLLDGHAVGRRVEVVGEVVHPLDERDDFPVLLVLAALLDAGVDVADYRLDVADGLALERCQQSQHPVRRRVVRPDVDRHHLGREVLVEPGHLSHSAARCR